MQKTAYELRIRTGVQTCALPIFSKQSEEAFVNKYYDDRRHQLHERFKVSIRQCAAHVLEANNRNQLAAKKHVVLRKRNSELNEVEETIGRASCRESVWQYV